MNSTWLLIILNKYLLIVILNEYLFIKRINSKLIYLINEFNLNSSNFYEICLEFGHPINLFFHLYYLAIQIKFTYLLNKLN